MTEKIRQTKISNSKGEQLLVSTIRFENGRYETGVFDTGWKDLAVAQCLDEGCALRTHDEYIAEYEAKAVEMSERYKKLAESLKAAVEAAKAVAGGEDGGTCNFDAPMIPATKWNQKLIELSAKEAGIRVFDTRICRHKYYIFSIPFGGQGNARTRQAEAMAQVMKAAGYDASVYYQID